jgi:hypothetical protein
MVVLNLDANEKIEQFFLTSGKNIKIGELSPQHKNRIFWLLNVGRNTRELEKQWRKLIPDLAKRLNGEISTATRTDGDVASFINITLQKLND